MALALLCPFPVLPAPSLLSAPGNLGAIPCQGNRLVPTGVGPAKAARLSKGARQPSSDAQEQKGINHLTVIRGSLSTGCLRAFLLPYLQIAPVCHSQTDAVQARTSPWCGERCLVCIPPTGSSSFPPPASCHGRMSLQKAISELLSVLYCTGDQQKPRLLPALLPLPLYSTLAGLDTSSQLRRLEPFVRPSWRMVAEARAGRWRLPASWSPGRAVRGRLGKAESREKE